MSLNLVQFRGMRHQLTRVDPALPHFSLQSIFYRLYGRSVTWEYQLFRGTAPRESGGITPDLAQLTEEFNMNFPFLNWRLLMRSYITKLKQRVRERRLQRRVKNTLFHTVDPTEFYQRLAVGV